MSKYIYISQRQINILLFSCPVNNQHIPFWRKVLIFWNTVLTIYQLSFRVVFKNCKNKINKIMVTQTSHMAENDYLLFMLIVHLSRSNSDHRVALWKTNILLKPMKLLHKVPLTLNVGFIAFWMICNTTARFF